MERELDLLNQHYKDMGFKLIETEDYIEICHEGKIVGIFGLRFSMVHVIQAIDSYIKEELL